MTPADYLTALYRDLPGDLLINLAAINDDGYHGDYVSLSDLRSDPACVSKFVYLNQEESRNIYHGVNPLITRNDTNKGKETDLGDELLFAHTDIDDIDPEEKLAELNGINATAINATSDVGLQIIWRFSEPVSRSEMKKINKGAVEKYGGDSAAMSPVQLVRMPGTINFPNKVKQAKGRKESDARTMRNDFDLVVDPVTLPRPRDTFLESLPLSDEMRLLMMTGKRDGETLDNSDARFAVMLDLISAGLDDDTLDTLLRDYDDLPIGPKDKKKNTARWRASEIKRALAKLPDWLRKFNERYFIVFHGGKTTVAELTKEDGREFYEFTRPNDKREFYDNQKVLVRGRRVKVWPLWMNHPRRRTYEKAVMRPDCDPGRMPNGDFNLWRGFSVKPKRGNFSLFRELIETVICDGKADLIEYVWQWLAFCVQRPGERPGVALVMHGGEGTGKGTLANEFGALFGSHFLPTPRIGDIVGQFNTHLRECLLLFADEALIAKNQKHDSLIKPLITDPTISCEPKGLKKIWVKNRLSWIMASNHDWVIPASKGARRYCVTNVSNCRQRDTKFFGALKKQMKKGGRAALLDHLLSLDLSDFESFAFPDTEALREQQDQSLDAMELFWRDRLADGGHDNASSPKFERVPVGLLFLQAQDFARRVRRPGMPDNQIAFAKRLREFLPAKPKLGNPTGFEYKSMGYGTSRTYIIPSLELCREFFAKEIIGRPVDWGDTLEVDPDDEPPLAETMRQVRNREIGALYIKLQGASDPDERAKFESEIAKRVSSEPMVEHETPY